MSYSNAAVTSAGDNPTHVEKILLINDELGLHARPAAKIAQAAQQFVSRITLHYDEVTVDAKSILDILTLAAGRGACLVLRCEGLDADSAASELTALLTEYASMEE